MKKGKRTGEFKLQQRKHKLNQERFDKVKLLRAGEVIENITAHDSLSGWKNYKAIPFDEQNRVGHGAEGVPDYTKVLVFMGKGKYRKLSAVDFSDYHKRSFTLFAGYRVASDNRDIIAWAIPLENK